jgi:hypothetical protein
VARKKTKGRRKSMMKMEKKYGENKLKTKN